MTRLTHLGLGVQIMLVASALLLADTFLDWQRVEFGLGRLGSGSVEVNAWDDFLGAMMGLLTIALLVWIVVRLAGLTPPIPISVTTVDVLLSGLVLAFALIKNVTNDYSTWASYVGVVLSLVIFGGALLEIRAGGSPDAGSGDSVPADAELASDLTGAGPRKVDAMAGTTESATDVSDAASDLTNGSSAETRS
jgi:hypothetical protein